MIPRSERGPEVAAKLARLRARLRDRAIPAAVLTRSANTAWLTAGAATYVNSATDGGASSLVITSHRAVVATDVIEAPRLRDEERLADLGFEFAVNPWQTPGVALAATLAGRPSATDSPGGELDLLLRDLRAHLAPEEIARARFAGGLAAAAMDAAARSVRPGMTEYAIAARLDSEARARGGQAIVNLVASDERVSRFRHPLPTARVLERYAMLVLSLRYEGLVLSTTRLVHFGPLPAEVRVKALAVAQVDARMILGTQAGRTLGDVYAVARDAYAEIGQPDAINQHHQGGSAGYQSREVLARPDEPTPIAAGQLFAWNPSLPGVKSEDTILLTDRGPEVVTAIPGWPMWEIAIPGGQTIARPAILEIV